MSEAPPPGLKAATGLSVSGADVFEGAGTADVVVRIDPPLPAGVTLGVDVSLVDGSAVLGDDYGTDGVPARVTLSGSVQSVTLRIPIVDDAIRESTESFTVVADPVAGDAGAVRASSTVTILDDDRDNARPIGSMVPVDPPCGVGRPPAPDGVAVTFDLSKSRDPDGRIAEWFIRWDDGSPDTVGTGAPGTAVHTFRNSSGESEQHVIELYLRDAEGLWSFPLHAEVLLAADGHLIRAGDSSASPQRPEIVITEGPTGDSSTWTFDFSGTADPDGQVTSWRVIWDDGSADSIGLSTLPSITHTFADPGFAAPWLFAVQVQVTGGACRNSLPDFVPIVVEPTHPSEAAPPQAKSALAATGPLILMAPVALLFLPSLARRRMRPRIPRRPRRLP